MYKVLSKDTIENEIIPYLSVAKRGYKTKSCLIEIVNCILYKLKTGVQWALLPVESLFSEVVLSYKTVFGHFRKWCKKGDWQDSWINILSNHKTHSCYLCSKRDVFKSSGFDFRSWKIYFLYHAHDYDEDYTMDLAELLPLNHLRKIS